MVRIFCEVGDTVSEGDKLAEVVADNQEQTQQF
jgi:pyruvate/2-oxoglutarate dehydrogenase complex dihydrolipoamide acyltransferase (E2) component